MRLLKLFWHCWRTTRNAMRCESVLIFTLAERKGQDGVGLTGELSAGTIRTLFTSKSRTTGRFRDEFGRLSTRSESKSSVDHDRRYRHSTTRYLFGAKYAGRLYNRRQRTGLDRISSSG